MVGMTKAMFQWPNAGPLIVNIIKRNLHWLYIHIFMLLLSSSMYSEESEFDNRAFLEEVYDFTRSEIILDVNSNYPHVLVTLAVGFVLLLLIVMMQHIIVTRK